MRKVKGGFPLVLVLLLLGLIGCGDADDGTPPIQPSSSNRAEIALRAYLAQNFAAEEWSVRLGTVDVRHRRAVISTTLDGDEAEAATELCSAVLSFERIKHVAVRYGRDRAEVCP
jgi:hypothetical protein